MDQLVLGVVRDSVRVIEGDARVDVELGVGVQAVSDPAHADAAHRRDARPRCQGGFGLIYEIRIDAVQQAPEDISCRSAQNGQDGHGDQQANDRIGQREPERDTARGQQHRQRREAVGAGVQAVGNQCGRTDSAAGADPVLRDKFVSEEPDHAGNGEHSEVADLAGLNQATVSKAEKGRSSTATYDLIDAAFARLEADANGIEEPVP